MTLQVYSARVSYRGDDRLDVTRKSAREGLFLAPSWNVLRPALIARYSVDLKRADLEAANAQWAHRDAERLGFELAALEREWDETWERYVALFTDEMRTSYRRHREAWVALLQRPIVTLCCYCADSQRCHRTLLARDILPKLGAHNAGEREEYAR